MLTQNPLSQERKKKLRWFVTLSTMPLLGVLTAFVWCRKVISAYLLPRLR